MTYLFCAVVIAAMVLVSVFAEKRFPAANRLPMQWGISGNPVWFAPRAAALAFTPVLASVVTLFVLLVAKDALHVPAMLVVGFLGGHLLHLWLVYRHLMRV